MIETNCWMPDELYNDWLIERGYEPEDQSFVGFNLCSLPNRTIRELLSAYLAFGRAGEPIGVLLTDMPPNLGNGFSESSAVIPASGCGYCHDVYYYGYSFCENTLEGFLEEEMRQF